ncbi:sulfatase-like hydrolase/transferase [Halovivax cerinus]|nr:sulfatase-like hydrolase/transferase [Halovivax cerinus]
MGPGTVRSTFSLLREEGFPAVVRKGGEKLSSLFTEEIYKVQDINTPEWMSNTDFNTYCIHDTEYIIAQDSPPNQTIDLEVDTSNASAIEVPIVGSERSESVTITSSTEIRRIVSDGTYDYPAQLWSTIPVDESTDTATIRISTDGASSRRSRNVFRQNTSAHRTRVGLPALQPDREQPPIFLLSIDTLPYSARESMQPIVEALGSDATIPTEPRTQAHWTPPSHGSMFTGTHPGDHGYVGHGKGQGDERPINPTLTTIPELLTDHGYKCSSLVSHTRILPEFGFGRGCHRYRGDVMGYNDWVSRNHDSRESLSQVIEWIDTDLQRRDHSLFYFVHVFDPHYPYLPPLDRLSDKELDLTGPSRYREQYDAARGETGEYLRVYERDHDVEQDLSAKMERYHSLSIEYTAEQVARFTDYLKSVDLFDDALIILTGDHGEEFGERGFFTHSSLYDRNIRPFMAIKPPATAEWSVPDTVNTVDFLPTIAHEIGADVPNSCAGEPLQTKDGNSVPRITERITPQRYNVAVESDGVKGIFTYDTGYPDRPSSDVIDAGPVLTEFYDVKAVRDGDFTELDGPSNAAELERIAEEFATSGAGGSYDSAVSATRPAQETEDRLQDLGYL